MPLRRGIVRALLIGAVSGFVGSMPVAGPTAALVLARAVDRRVREAWLVGVGSAAPEGLYAFLACWGMTAALARFPALVGVSRVVCGAALAAVGVWLIVRAPSVGHVPEREAHRNRGVVVGFAMTLANPTLLLSWTAAVGALHSVGLLPVDERAAAPFALGVAVGVAAWFTVMIRLVVLLRERVRSKGFAGLVRGAGALLVAGGVLVVVRAVAHRL